MEKNLQEINVIYYDGNLIYENKDIYKDCQKIEIETKGSVILVNNLINLNLLLKDILINYPKCKFILVINGSSAKETISFIKQNNYKSIFINSCIYTNKKEKYLDIQKNNSDFINEIYCKLKPIIEFIKINFQKMKEKNIKFPINSLINYQSYKENYFNLHMYLSVYYGEEPKELFDAFSSSIKNEIKHYKYTDEDEKEFINVFKSFSSVDKKNYEEIISYYLKYQNFSKNLNLLLMKKDISIFKKVGYFVGNLMHSIVEYGKSNSKGVDSGKILYKGVQLNIVDLLEFLKNKNTLITFPYFFTLTTNKNFAEISSQRNNEDIKNKDLFSVIMKIDYLYDDGYEPCIFDLRDLAPYPDEEDYIILPFTFMKLDTIKIDSNKLIADLELKVIGKEEILEDKIRGCKEIFYDKGRHIMFAK